MFSAASFPASTPSAPGLFGNLDVEHFLLSIGEASVFQGGLSFVHLVHNHKATKARIASRTVKAIAESKTAAQALGLATVLGAKHKPDAALPV